VSLQRQRRLLGHNTFLSRQRSTKAWKGEVILSSITTYVNAVKDALTPLRDDKRAVAMAAYMKNHFQFLGIQTPTRRMAVRAISRPELTSVPGIARALWKQKEREYHYVAVDLLSSMSKKLDAYATLKLLEELALKNSWWDCVDGLAGVGSVVLLQNPDERKVVWEWSSHKSLWVNRLAILHQKGWGEKTDQKVLFRLCLAHAHSNEFFVRKAIGWALRDYAWTDPIAVKKFVEANSEKLSKLSAREALKNINKSRNPSAAE
jgi:3-methyladenine DNA glycosylase AlkD